jgi:hypothetical protein
MTDSGVDNGESGRRGRRIDVGSAPDGEAVKVKMKTEIRERKWDDGRGV